MWFYVMVLSDLEWFSSVFLFKCFGGKVDEKGVLWGSVGFTIDDANLSYHLPPSIYMSAVLIFLGGKQTKLKQQMSGKHSCVCIFHGRVAG